MQMICIKHNGINQGQGWVFQDQDVTEIVRLSQKPTVVDRCPKCLEEVDRKKKFLRGG